MAPTKRAGKAAKALLGNAGASGGQSGPQKVKKADWSETFTRKKTAGVSDMTLLSTISNDSINDNLRKRFENAEIYTYIGHVLISVNPFRLLPIYDDATLKSYRNKNRLEMPPHVYAIAESMYYQMVSYHENQCVIISGESGAGKTEAAKRIMQYIAEVSAAKDASSAGIGQIRDIILATNPLLESFGCAKTLRNNNSSRHGKYLEIEFDAHGSPVGALITNYLLEKGRVVGQIKNERNFHIFYQLTKGASPQQQEMYGLQGPSAYAYTSRANCLDVEGIDDVADWHETLRAMQTIGLSQREIDNILRMLAIILWLGNVTFRADAEGNSTIADPSVPEFVAYLMEAPGGAAAVTKALTLRTVETQRGGRRGSVYEVPMNVTQAASARDALSKAVYNNLFEWIVDRVNISMKSRSAAAHVVGILDIYGFEIFDNNSFEQLCINYVNEKLQQIFIQLTLKTEQEEYVREQIKWTPIDYFNNKIVCDLIEEKRPPGVFAALNDACATAHADPTAADNSFVQRLGMLGTNPHFDGRGDKFLIRHYAGDVMYNVSGMTDKNKDVLGNDMLLLVASSNNAFLQTLFPERPDPNSKKRPPTAGDRIKASANALVEKLMRSQPSYIRTIKPNSNKSPTEYDTKAILHQIKYLGLQENIRVRRAGFAYRNTFEKMVERFYLLSPATSYAGDYIWQGDAKSGCARILADTGIAREEWQMGITKAFIKNPETLFALEAMRDKYWHNMAARIQRAFRNYIRYKQECASRIQRFWKNKKEGIAYVQLRDSGHQALGGRKERRRFSLVSMRQFRGDYMGVGGRTPQADLLRNACALSPTDKIIFSMTIQLLVSKLGRSSTRSPRYLILANRTLFILITQVIQNRPQTTVERRIPLATIRSVQTSTLRDDWLTLNVQASEEADPLICCVFKTELITHLLQQSNNAISLVVAPQIEYQKKKGKNAVIKFVKDESVPRDDVYKSQTVSVPSGDPASSGSWPPAARTAGVARPIGQGKLLRPGGPSQSTAPRPKPASKPTPAARPLPSSSMTAPAQPVAQTSRLPAAPPALAAALPKAVAAVGPRQAPAAPGRAAAPPPPPPVVPSVPQYKALYAFDTAEDGEMSLVKGEVVELVQKETNGWYLVRKGGKEGWTPSDYLQEIVAEKPKPTLAPPPPKPSMNGSTNSAGSTPTASGRTTPSIPPKPGAKPAVGAKPAAPRPPAANGSAPALNGGQMNLAAALAKRLQQQQQG